MSAIVKFVKDEKGNVLVYKTQDNSLLWSINPAQNVVKDPSNKETFKIQSDVSFGRNPLVLKYEEVDCLLCEPPIIANNFNDFLIELSNKFFFFLDSDSAGAEQNNFVKQIIINVNDLPLDYNEQDICDYILSLPAEQRTITETDSKCNVIIEYVASS